jgi:general secretion pathway protein K
MITKPVSTRRQRASKRGSALILVFWLIFMLSMIVSTMLRIVGHDMTLTIAQKQAFRARQVAEMGINFAMNPAVKEYDRDLLNQSGAGFNLCNLEPDESFSVRIRGEGGRMNINALLQQGQQDITKRTFLTNLFSLWGLDNDAADGLFNMMIDWTDADSNNTGAARGTEGMEKDEYVALYGENSPYPFNRPFYNLEEMRLVPGFDALIANLPDWRDYFTIYSVDATINPNEAEPKVLVAVGLAVKNTQPTLDDFLDWLPKAQDAVVELWGSDGIEDTEDDEEVKIQNAEEMLSVFPFLDLTEEQIAAGFGFRDQTVHIESVATVGEFRKRVVLIVRGRTATPQILSREEVPLFQ